MCTVFVRNWSIANQSGSLLIQREPNCVKLIKSDRCICFHSWLRCSAEPLSLYFIKILPKSIKGSVFYTLTLSLIKLALIILADDWSLAKKPQTIPGYMSWTLWVFILFSWAAQLKGQNFKHMLTTVNHLRRSTVRSFVSQNKEDRQQLYGYNLQLIMASFQMSARVSEAFPALHDNCVTVQLSIKRNNE